MFQRKQLTDIKIKRLKTWNDIQLVYFKLIHLIYLLLVFENEWNMANIIQNLKRLI